MPLYEVKDPQGNTYDVYAPDGATKEQVIAYAQQQSQMHDVKQRAAAGPNLRQGGDPTAGLDSLENFAAGMGKLPTDIALGSRQSIGLAGPAEGREKAQLDAPLMASGPGMAGNVTGNLLGAIGGGLAARGIGSAAELFSAPRLAQGAEAVGKSLIAPDTFGGAGAMGALQGALQPAEGPWERAGNTMLGAGAGGLGLAAPRVLGAGVGALRGLVEPFTESGQSKAAARLMSQFGADPNMQPVISAVPGVNRTLAEATRDPGMAQLERAIQTSDPEFANALVQRRELNNQARLQALGGIAGDEGTMAAAASARDKAALPLLAEAKKGAGVNTQRVVNYVDSLIKGRQGNDEVTGVLANVRDRLVHPISEEDRLRNATNIIRSSIDRQGRMSSSDFDALLEARRVVIGTARGGGSTDDAIEVLKTLKPDSKLASVTIRDALKVLRSDTGTYDDVSTLYNVRQGIDNLLAGRVSGDSKASQAATRELLSVKAALDHQIGKVAPEFKGYLTAYQAGSKPVDQMRVGQTLMQRTTGSTEDRLGNLTLSPPKFGQAMKDPDALAASATGFRKAKFGDVMTPEQQGTIGNVRDDLMRQNYAQTAGRSVGSPTQQYSAAQNLVRQTLGPLGVPEGLQTHPALAGLTKALNKAYAMLGANDPKVLREALLDPAKAQRILYYLPKADQRELEDYISRLSLSQAATAGAMSGEAAQ